MCGKHYGRWRHSGNVHRGRPLGRPPCTIEGCDKPNVGRGWCSKHWTRWKRYGDPEYRIRGEVRDGKKICSKCGVDRHVAYYTPGAGRSECKVCMAARRTVWRTEHPDMPPRVVGTPKVCDACKQPFMANGKQSRYCSLACFRAYKNIANWPHMVRRRARLAGALAETFRREDIFERDGWMCGICEASIDRELRWPNPMSVSLDHVVPLARGGTHHPANAQASHLICNLRKGAKIA
jgi:hypothetical protein